MPASTEDTYVPAAPPKTLRPVPGSLLWVTVIESHTVASDAGVPIETGILNSPRSAAAGSSSIDSRLVRFLLTVPLAVAGSVALQETRPPDAVTV